MYKIRFIFILGIVAMFVGADMVNASGRWEKVGRDAAEKGMKKMSKSSSNKSSSSSKKSSSSSSSSKHKHSSSSSSHKKHDYNRYHSNHYRHNHHHYNHRHSHGYYPRYSSRYYSRPYYYSAPAVTFGTSYIYEDTYQVVEPYPRTRVEVIDGGTQVYRAVPAQQIYGVTIRKEVQRRLARMGYYRGAIDGIIGKGSRSAISQFQRNQGIPQTGVIDEYLLAELGIE